MDFFIDKYYKKDVENKLNYHQILYGTNDDASFQVIGGTPTTTSFQVIGGTPTTTIIHENVVVLFSSSIDNVHVLVNNVYMQEFKISTTAKKFVLE
jgi:hypothetical protein